MKVVTYNKYSLKETSSLIKIHLGIDDYDIIADLKKMGRFNGSYILMDEEWANYVIDDIKYDRYKNPDLYIYLARLITEKFIPSDNEIFVDLYW